MNNFNYKFQHTLNKSFYIKSIGQHSGKIVKICIKPAETDTGIKFVDMENKKIIELNIENINANSGCSNIRNIHTIEHVLSAISGMGIDNAIIESWGGEIPICDGSAKVFAKKIKSIGIKEQNKKRRYLKILKSITVNDEQNGIVVSLDPIQNFNGLDCEVKIIYDTPAIGVQSFKTKITLNHYYNLIAPARSFARIKDILFWHSQGFALGASLKTGIGVDDKHILNKEGLRFKNEFSKHKILDAVGDLRTCGYPIIGSYKSIKGGHQQNNLLIKKLLSDRSNFELIEL